MYLHTHFCLPCTIDKRLNSRFAYSPIRLIVHLPLYLKKSISVMVNCGGGGGRGEHRIDLLQLLYFFTNSQNSQNQLKGCYGGRGTGQTLMREKTIILPIGSSFSDVT